MKHCYIILFLFLSLAACKNEEPKEVVAPDSKEAVVKTTFDISKAAGQDYLIDDQHSYIGFKIKYFGFSPVRGRFNTFNGRVFYDPNFPEHTYMTLFIEVESINTGNERRDQDLITGEGWFQEKEFPHIIFTTKFTEVSEDGALTLHGDFTMNGITKQIQIPFEKPTEISRDWAANEQVDYSGTLTLDRKDYDVYGGDFWDTVMENGVTQLSDEVEIELDIHTRRADYQERYTTLEADDVRKRVLDAFKLNGMEAGMTVLEAGLSNNSEKYSAGALSTIGNTLLAWNMLPSAKAVYQKAADLYPDKASYPCALGIVLLKEGEPIKATSFFEKAIAMDPQNSRAHLYLQQ